MKDYTNEEIRKALLAAPEPVRDFAVSPTLMKIYDGIQEKHRLDPWQMVSISQLITTMLVGLERESALEITLHQLYPALSHTALTELVADINTRVFKEAKRRLDENILEPSSFSSFPEPDPTFPEYNRLNTLEENDPEKAELAAQEDAVEQKEFEEFQRTYKPPEETEELTEEELEPDPQSFDALVGEETAAPIQTAYEQQLNVINAEFAAKEAELAAKRDEALSSKAPALTPRTRLLESLPVPTAKPSTAPEEPRQSISSVKLAAPTVAAKEEVRVESPADANAPAPFPSANAVVPPAPSKAADTPAKPLDPYRESID